MKPWQILLLGIFLGLAVGAAILIIATPNLGEGIELLPDPSPMPDKVHVSGAVLNAGVYDLPPGSRYEDAIYAAGGLQPNADVSQINMAKKVSDGEKIVVPEKCDTCAAQDNVNNLSPAVEKSQPGGLLNLNTASLEDLEKLPGIGPSRAKDIVAYRDKIGGFLSLSQLDEVPGIGQVTLNQLKEWVTIE